jgi:hypothetical protein
MKIRPLGAEFFCADKWTGERTDTEIGRHDEGDGHFSQFCESTSTPVM